MQQEQNIKISVVNKYSDHPDGFIFELKILHLGKEYEMTIGKPHLTIYTTWMKLFNLEPAALQAAIDKVLNDLSRDKIN